ENKKIIINPKEAKIVKFIFETYLKEGYISKVVKALNKRGYKTKNGKDFIYTSIRHILENPIYAGKIKYSGEINQGNHEAIIDEIIFEEVQRMLNRNKKECKSIKQNKYDFLLRGLLRCGYCGSNLTTHYTVKNGDRFFYYKCTRIQHRDKTACLSKPLPGKEFDNVMVKSIGEIAQDNRLLKRILKRSNHVVLNEIEELRKEEIKFEKEIERKSEEIRKLLNLFLLDKNPPIEVREEVNKRSKEKEELEKKLEEIRLKIRRRESTVIDFEIIKKGFEGFYKVYPSLEPKERQTLARLFMKEVKIFNDKVDVEFLEFPELAHQDPVQILKEPSIRGGLQCL
ncbi:MAG: recombinase family protein, partial [Synergistetes bacterium]|nr:recombinase family protein [Synergistota bacterium]